MKIDKNINVIFGGIGGQGILKASELCGWAAMLAGFHVKKSEVHGMAQRGGSVESHLRFGEKVFSPLIEPKSADFLICFHREEHSRLKKFLRPGGKDLLKYLDAAEKSLENPKCLNTFLVGVLSVYLPMSESHWKAAIARVFGEKIIQENTAVFFKGRELAAL